MTQSPRSLFLGAFFGMAILALGDAGFAVRSQEGTEITRPLLAQLKRGMTAEEVRRLVGFPKRVARQVLYHRYREQWIYDVPKPFRITFDCPRGEAPHLLSIQSEPQP